MPLRPVFVADLLAFSGKHLGVDLDDAVSTNHQLILVRNIQCTASFLNNNVIGADPSDLSKYHVALSKALPLGRFERDSIQACFDYASVFNHRGCRSIFIRMALHIHCVVE